MAVSVCTLASTAAAGSARAQAAPATVAPTPTVAPGAEAEARALYTAGQAAFHEGRYENALEYLTRSYELSRRPALLFNLGTTYDRLRRDAEALAAFQQYLHDVPEAENRLEVEARIAVLREAAARSTPPPAVVEPDPVPEPQPPTTPPPAPATSSDAGPAPWIVVGVGGAAVVAGAVLMGVAAADVAAVEGASRGTRWETVEGAYARSEAESIAGAVLLGVGGAAALGGIVWAVTGSGGTRVEVSPTAGGLVARGTF